MRRLFRSFERFGVDYLLISGQASVLYGAATFSEDVDIWAARHTFRAESRAQTLALLGKTISVGACSRQISREMAALQRKDIAYWRLRRHSLRRLHREGKLEPVGAPVTP